MINNAGLLTLNKLEMTEYNGVYLVCWILTETNSMAIKMENIRS